MKTAVFTIKDHSDITKTISYLHTNYSQAINDGKPLVVSIDQKQQDRSKAQNRLYWMYLTQWAKKQGTDKDYEHNFFKRTLLARIYHRDDVAEYRNTYNAVKQFSEYLNRIHNFALVRLGIMLTIPDELRFAI